MPTRTTKKRLTTVVALGLALGLGLRAWAGDPPTEATQAIESLEQLLVEYDEGTTAPHAHGDEAPLVSLRAEVEALRAENKALREQNEELRVLCPAPIAVPDPVPALGPWLP